MKEKKGEKASLLTGAMRPSNDARFDCSFGISSSIHVLCSLFFEAQLFRAVHFLLWSTQKW